MPIFIFLQSAGVIVIPNLSNIHFSLTKMNRIEQTLSQHFRLIVIHQTNEMDEYCILATSSLGMQLQLDCLWRTKRVHSCANKKKH
jgi:hypothetical protein